jgi:hypothetical protein
MRKLSFAWIKDRMEHHSQKKAAILSQAQGGVFKLCGGTAFLYSECVHFARSYHHTSRKRE